MVIITSDGRGPDTLGAAYNGKVATAQIQQDFATLAREFGLKPGKAKVSNKKGIAGGEVRLTGIVDWNGRAVRLEPILRTYQRYPFLRVVVVFDRPFPLANMGEPIREGYRVETRGGGNVIDYWLRRTDGTEATAPTPVAERSRLPGWFPFLMLGLIAAVVGGGVFWIARNILGERRAARDGYRR